MHDISDPSGAGRGDRRQARRLVDDAYAAGRISAIDRSLRVEQIDAASTRGDLAMIVRDLAGGDPPPQQQASAAVSGPSEPPPRPPVAGDVPPWPGAPTPSASTPSASTSGTSAAPSWPPPTFTPGAAQAGGAGSSTSGTDKKVVGCIVAVVLFLFLAPCLLGIVVLGLGVATSSSSDGSSSGGPDDGFSVIEPVGGTYAGGYTWDDLTVGLADAVGTTEVVSIAADPVGATLVVDESGTQVTWTWQDGGWARTQEGGSSGGPTPVDLAEVSDATLESAIQRVGVEQALASPRGSMVRIDTFGGTPRITVTVAADDGSGTATYALDELG